MAAFNLSNAIIGAGVGGMPYALKEAGFYSGVLLLGLVALCTDYSVRLLIRCGQTAGKKYYEQLVASQFGHAGYVAVLGAMGVFAFGAMCAYLIGVGDTMSIVVSHWSGIDLATNAWLKRVVLVSVAVGAVLPLALVKNMSKLSKTSFASICLVIFIICVVVSRWAGGAGDAHLPTTDAERALAFIAPDFFPAIGIISFAFVCHHACFIVYNTLRDNTEARWARTVHTSVGVAAGVMATLALAAYLTFRGVMNSNFLTNYSATDELVNVMRCTFAVTQALTFPLELFVARHVTHALAFPTSSKAWTPAQHYTITLLLWGAALAIALNVTDLGIVLELTGGISAVFIGFVLPAALHFKMSRYNVKLWKNPPEARRAAAAELLPSIGLLIFGLLAMIFTLITIGTNLALGESGPRDAFDTTSDSTGSGDATNTTSTVS